MPEIASERERFLRWMSFQEVDRIPLMDMGVWDETLDRWHHEGLPKWVTNLRHLENYLNLDRSFNVNWIPINDKVYPLFEREVLDETENEHVVRDWARVRARLADGRTYEVTVLGTDPPTDLALLQLEGLDGPLQPAELGDSDAAQVGDWVAAVGNPLGLENTMTRGIISAKGRRQLQNDPRSYMEFLQTDAAINPGSSGGPLFDLDGRVVGINAALNKEGQGIAFAIPANMAREIVLRLRESGVVERGWLGVIITPVEGAEEGVRVIDALPGSPAHGAGLVDGDIIRTVQGVPVASPFDLRWRIAMAGVGQRVTLEVRRAGESRLVSVTLGSLGGGRATTRRRP